MGTEELGARHAATERWRALALDARVVAIGVLAIGAFVALHAINHAAGDGRFLSVDQEQNLPTWARSLLYAFAAGACLTAARWGTEHRRTWLWLGVLLAVFSLDDVAMGHEWLEDQGHGHALITIWEPVAAVLVLAVFWRAHRTLPSPQRTLVVLAGVSLVLGQICSSLGDEVHVHGEVVLLSLFEQSFEAMVGVLLLAAAAGPARRALRRWAYASTDSLS